MHVLYIKNTILALNFMITDNLKVAILIPTMNRADFVIRQLQYYASVNCPHTIYIGDSSNQENSEK